ncbi:MAG: DUF192 domain-containing protein [Flavobacteriaceae bacterium]|nr:DUF192 domain-containing protein [Flavobacteriaceae bacterium]
MKKTYLLLSTSLAIFCLLACKENQKEKPIQQEFYFKKEGSLQILDSAKTIKKHLDIEIADNDYERQTGLMYRKEMQENQAMLFIMPQETQQNFYMKNTYIGLDIIYINKDKKIVGIHKNAKPLDETGIPSKVPALYVLEVLAGKSDNWKIEVGDFITWQN